MVHVEDKKIKILYISRVSKITGAESILLDIVKNIDKERFHPVVALPDDKGPLYYRLIESNIETRIIRMPFLHVNYNPFLLIWFLISIKIINIIFFFFIIRNKIDIISCHTIQEAFYVAIPAKLSGKKLIISFKNILDKKWKKKIRARFAGIFADSVVAVSQKAALDFSSYNSQKVNKKKLKIINDCLDYDEYIKNVREEDLGAFFTRETGDFIIVNIGNISELKGQALLVDSMASDKLKGRDIRVVLVGDIYNEKDMPYKEGLVEMIKKNSLEDKVFMIGYNKNVKGILRSTDVLVHCPVLDDAFPRVILEGFASANIVIATKVGGIPEIIEDGKNGFLVDTEREALAEKILDVYQNRYNLKNIRENAISILKDRFSLKNQLIDMQDLYKDLAGVKDE